MIDFWTILIVVEFFIVYIFAFISGYLWCKLITMIKEDYK